MPRPVSAWTCLPAIALLLAACAAPPKAPDAGRWIRHDARTQRYSVDAQQVPRGALLDELSVLSKAQVRPQPRREESITAQASGLDLEGLVALLLPPGTRAVVRGGESDVPGARPDAGGRKEGPTLRPAAGSVLKPAAELDAGDKAPAGATLKLAADAPAALRGEEPARGKAKVDVLLRVADTTGPKQALPQRAEAATVRLVLQFDEGAEPRLIDAQLIDGRAPEQRFVTGSYLFAIVGADGRVLQAGTFQDPLVQRSYQAQGPHAVQRARSGTVGISVAREHLREGRLQVTDMSGIAMPRELNAEAVRAALERGRTTLRLDNQTLLRRLDREIKQ